MPDAATHGRIAWCDLMTLDTAAAAAFYTETVGWSSGSPPMQADADHPYTMLKSPEGTPIGGTLRLPEQASAAGAPPHWIAYIATSDLDASLAKVTELGGAVRFPPTEIPQMGRFAIVTDPQGAGFALFEGPHVPGRDDEAHLGEWSWFELMSTDWEAAWAFYSALLGWERADDFEMGPMGTYRMWRRPGHERVLGGMFTKPADAPGPPFWLPYVRVADVDAHVAAATSKGAKVLNGPMEVPGGDRVAQLMDPQGAAYAVHWANPEGAKR